MTMIVKTKNPIISTQTAKRDYFSAIDASNSGQVTAFQKFANTKGAGLTVDGKWGSKTAKAFSKYGQQFEDSMNKMLGLPSTTAAVYNAKTGAQKANDVFNKGKDLYGKAQNSGILSSVGNMFGLNTGSNTPAPTDTPAMPDSPTDAPKQGMSKGAKIGIAVGVVALVGLGIYFATKKKSK